MSLLLFNIEIVSQPIRSSVRRRLIVYVSLSVHNDSDFYEFGKRIAVAQYAGDRIHKT